MTQDDDELGSDENGGQTTVGAKQQAGHSKFIASLKSELESARVLINTQKAQMLALVKRTRDMNNELKHLRAMNLMQREFS